MSKSAQRKIFFVTRGAQRVQKKRQMTLRGAVTHIYVKKQDFKSGGHEAGRLPDHKVVLRGAKKLYRRSEPQKLKEKTPNALQKAVTRVRQSEFKKVYKDLKGKFKELGSNVMNSS